MDREERPLPPFRIPRLTHPQNCQPDAPVLPRHERQLNTVVAMRRRSYDKLMAENPKAALRYFDEADGEDITVGSHTIQTTLQSSLADLVDHHPGWYRL